jgi:hypothetical protein
MSDYEEGPMAERDRAARTMHNLLRKVKATDRAQEALRVLIDTPPELWGAHEAAACLGVARPNLGTLRGLPAPTCRVGNGAMPIYLADEIRAFADERGTRHEGRRP